jgi:hypothetical protein
MTVFETEPCGRCGGSGKYSYCQMYGTRCFGCGGTGKRLTKRGAAASAYLRALRTVKARDVQLGDYIKVDATPGISAGGWCRIETMYTRLESGKSLQPDGSWKVHNHLALEGTDKRGQSYGLHTFPDADVVLVPKTKAEANAQVDKALEYQATLTKAGTPRKKGTTDA